MMCFRTVCRVAFALTVAAPAISIWAQSAEDYIPPPELGAAISIPKPNEKAIDETQYSSPELTDTQAAVGSQLIDGRLPRPRMDYSVVTDTLLQRLSFFENGLVILHVKAGDANLRKRMILPEGALDDYLALLSNAEIDRILHEEDLKNGLTTDPSFIRIWDDDRSYSQVEFSNSRVLPSTVQQLRTSLDDLIRILAEDRGATNPLVGYTPKVGDKLISEDMKLFEITALSGENQIVEFTGIQEPVRVYVLRDDIPSYFHAILGRQPN